MDRFIERGHAHDDWTVIAKDAIAARADQARETDR
jgi:hypothetical protein